MIKNFQKIKHFCGNDKHCNTKDCVVCLVPDSVCESSFTRSRYLEGPCCEACEINEAMINFTKPEWSADEVIDYIRMETFKANAKMWGAK